MKILFGKEHYGKNVSEVPSGFLVWIIEQYDKADWSLVDACKAELLGRLKVSWEPPTPPEITLRRQVSKLEKIVLEQKAQLDILEKCIIMATVFKANRIAVDGYLGNPKLLDSHIHLIKESQN